jgi:hypothetical protein
MLKVSLSKLAWHVGHQDVLMCEANGSARRRKEASVQST